MPAPAYRTILVPLDGLAFAEEALAPAAQLATATGAELRLLRVVELPLHPYGSGYVAVGFDPTSQLVRAREYLESTAEGLRAQGLEVTVRSDAGAPGQVIGEHAQVRGTDLLVMATHGHTGLARVALGSLAAATLQRANRPTVLVRPEAIRAAAPAPSEEPGRGRRPTRTGTGEMTLSVQLNADGVALSAPGRMRIRRRMRALERRRVHHPGPVAVLVLRRHAGGRLPAGEPVAEGLGRAPVQGAEGAGLDQTGLPRFLQGLELLVPDPDDDGGRSHAADLAGGVGLTLVERHPLRAPGSLRAPRARPCRGRRSVSLR
jgi:nucleotide-binding universal stress UspA family protein